MNLYTFQSVIAFLIASLVAYLLTPLVERVAHQEGVIREPRARDIHTRPTPLWGGIAIYLAVLLGTLGVLSISITQDLIAILVGATIVALIGVLDDCLDLSAGIQTLAILLGALITALLGVQIEFISRPFGSGEIPLGAWGLPLTLLWMFFITKAVDTLDGLDGLAAGVSAIASATLALMALGTKRPDLAVLCASTSGACIGFLRYNFNPARIFMGTVGAQFLGFVLAGTAVAGLFKVATTVALFLPVMVLGVPVFDALYVTVKRLLRGQPIYKADKGHVHHMLVRRGFTQKQTVLLLYAISLLLSLLALQVFSRSLQ